MIRGDRPGTLAELRTARLVLRRMVEADLDDLVRFHADPRVMGTLGGTRDARRTADDLTRNLEHWERHGFGYWTAVDAASGAFAGRGGLRRIEIGGAPEVELGYGLLPAYWGSGLATELACAGVRAAFDLVGLQDLICFSLPGNAASRRVMEKAGFTYERDVVYAGLDHVLYRLWAGDRPADEGGEG